MESTIPQQTISQMRQSLGEMDISPVRKMEINFLLDKVEAKGGLAPKELKKLGKIMETEKKQIKRAVIFAQQARAATSKFIQKTDKIFRDYLTALKK